MMLSVHFFVKQQSVISVGDTINELHSVDVGGKALYI